MRIGSLRAELDGSLKRSGRAIEILGILRLVMEVQQNLSRIFKDHGIPWAQLLCSLERIKRDQRLSVVVFDLSAMFQFARHKIQPGKH